MGGTPSGHDRRRFVSIRRWSAPIATDPPANRMARLWGCNADDPTSRHDGRPDPRERDLRCGASRRTAATLHRRDARCDRAENTTFGGYLGQRTESQMDRVAYGPFEHRLGQCQRRRHRYRRGRYSLGHRKRSVCLQGRISCFSRCVAMESRRRFDRRADGFSSNAAARHRERGHHTADVPRVAQVRHAFAGRCDERPRESDARYRSGGSVSYRVVSSDGRGAAPCPWSQRRSRPACRSTPRVGHSDSKSASRCRRERCRGPADELAPVARAEHRLCGRSRSGDPQGHEDTSGGCADYDFRICRARWKLGAHRRCADPQGVG